MLAAATLAIGEAAGDILASAPIVASDPVGPSQRRYANGAVLLDSALEPLDLLDRMQAIETRFGRRRRGARWRARVLDIDIVLWSGGAMTHPRLTIPHPHFRDRTFVTGPAQRIAPQWRDPLSGMTLRQLNARLTRPRRLPR